MKPTSILRPINTSVLVVVRRGLLALWRGKIINDTFWPVSVPVRLEGWGSLKLRQKNGQKV